MDRRGICLTLRDNTIKKKTKTVKKYMFSTVYRLSFFKELLNLNWGPLFPQDMKRDNIRIANLTWNMANKE